GSCTSTCASAATSRRTARATSPGGAWSSRRASSYLWAGFAGSLGFTCFSTVKQKRDAAFHVVPDRETTSGAVATLTAVEQLSAFERGGVVGVLIGEGSFGGDGKQPQVTLRMHVRHEALFRWLIERFPRTRLYGPY